MASHTWSNWSGMKPVSPSSGGEKNPVTLLENFIIRDDGTLDRRSGFSSVAFTFEPRNAMIISLTGAVHPWLILKTDGGWYYKDSASSGLNSLDSSGLPVEYQSPAAGDRGSFCAFNGEIYYCDQESIWRSNGSSAILTPVGMPDFDLGDPDDTFTYCATFDPSEEEKWWKNGCTFDPETCEPTGGNCKLKAGAKTGTFAVSYSWYDRQRNIYGPRSRPETAVIAAYSDGEPVKLFGYEITIPTPDNTNYSSQYDVVVWVSQSVSVKILFTRTECNGGECDVTYTISHQFGDQISDLHFFEGIAGGVGEAFICRKDNAALGKQGPALDTYEAPYPSDLMSILPDGTALYFNPSIIATLGDQRYAIEYSVGHPEQIGRDRDDRRPANGPTIAHAANLKGKPLATIDNDGIQLVLTDQEVYGLTLAEGRVILSPYGQSHGVRSTKSITHSPVGTSYLADEGHVLISGNQSILLDVEAGYSNYTMWLANTQREAVAGGHVGDYLFLWMPDFDPFALARGGSIFSLSENQSAIIYDHSSRAVLKFKLGPNVGVKYAAGGKMRDGSYIFAYTGAKELRWPSSAKKDDGTSFSSIATMWLNDDMAFNKRITGLVIEYGNVTGISGSGASGPEVIVRGFEHWNDLERNYTQRKANSGTAKYHSGNVKNRRVVYNEFSGMNGRYFEITVRTDSGTGSGNAWTEGELAIVSVTVEYESDNEGTDRGSPGINN